jgi:hypothetical protein
MLSAEKAGAFYISDCLACVVRVSHGDDGFVSIGEWNQEGTVVFIGLLRFARRAGVPLGRFPGYRSE